MIIRHLNGNLYEADFENNAHYIRQVIIQEHINTLEKLKKHLGKHIIGSHFSNELNLLKDMETEINERIAYLKITQKSFKKADYETIKNQLTLDFDPRWHTLMLRFCEEQNI